LGHGKIGGKKRLNFVVQVSFHQENKKESPSTIVPDTEPREEIHAEVNKVAPDILGSN